MGQLQGLHHSGADRVTPPVVGLDYVQGGEGVCSMAGQVGGEVLLDFHFEDVDIQSQLLKGLTRSGEKD